MKLSNLYPGNVWFKRLGYLVLVYSIGINCFVGKIQNEIIHEIENKTNEIESTNKLLTAKKYPDLGYLKIEKGSSLEYAFESFRGIAKRLNYHIITVDRINEIANINNSINEESQKITKHIDIIKNLLHTILTVIKITSNLIWISIIWAIIWLYFDLKKGNVKRFVKIGLMLSIPFNVIVFYSLLSYINSGLFSSLS